jgi:hypothetical protein
MKPIQLFIGVLLVAQLAAADPLVFSKVQPAPELNALFDQKDNWIGADGDYSVLLTSERTLWLFSDTWVGSIRHGKRINATIVNNSIALQDGQGANASLTFIIRHDVNGKPTSFLSPEDHRGWFWLQSGVCIDKRLFIFLMQVEKTGTTNKGVFGFHQIGEWLGIVTNPFDPPLAWHVEQRRLPCESFLPEHQLTFGSAALVDGDYLYIYGTEKDVKTGNRGLGLVAARARTNEVADLSRWRYYKKGKWQTDFQEATSMADGMASECSVSFLPKLGQYVLIYTDRGLSPNIQARTASHPWGEWSGPTTVYQCPEMGRYTNIFCYAAKAHPSQGTRDQIVISYVANSYSFWQDVDDASLYWPRFIRVQMATGGK